MKKLLIIIVFILFIFILSCEYYTGRLIGPDDTPEGPALVVKDDTRVIDHGGEYNFGNVPLGEVKRVTFTLENIGTEILKVESVHTNGSDEFLIENDETRVDLEPGKVNDIVVKFVSDKVGFYEAVFTVESNDPVNNGIYEINLVSNVTSKSWEVSQILSNHTSDVSSVAFSSNNDTLVSGGFDNNVIIWKLVNNQWEFEEKLDNTNSIYSVDVSHNNQIICGDYEGNIINWYHDGVSWLSDVYQKHTYAVLTLDILSGGTKFVSGSGDHTIIVWEWEDTTWSDNYTLTDHSNPVNSVAFNSDGTEIVSGGMDNKIIVWEYDGVNSTWNNVFQSFQHGSAVKRAVFSSDDSKIVSCSTSKIIIWERDAADGWIVEDTLTISGTVVVNSVDISPTGLTIVAGLADSRVLIYEWDDASMEWLLKHDIGEEHSYDVLSVDFDSYGGTIATSSKDKSIRIWN